MKVFRNITALGPALLVLASFLGADPAGAERTQPGETSIIDGCPGDKFSVTDAEGETTCFCPQGTSEVGDFCVSQDLADFFDDPWGTVCGYFGCGSGSGAPTEPEMEICDARNGFTCAEEFDACRADFRTNMQVCQSRKLRTAQTSCDGNIWPNNSRFANWHRVGGWWCPNPDDDPNDYDHWRFNSWDSQCQRVADVHEQCMDAWLHDANSGSSGSFSLFGVGGGGGSGAEPAGDLAKARCSFEEIPKHDACIKRVEEVLACPADCDPAVAERIVLDPLRPDQRPSSTDGSTRAALVALNRQEQEHALTRLGYLFLDRGHTNGAIGIFRVVVANFPDSANARHSLGEALEEAGQAHLAEARYREALGINPTFSAARDDLVRLVGPSDGE
ncbi:hypothetical protein SAMN05421759_11947 [Roseivivax lentus]|uniref:Uncharacterized protein n=1 Tax=Roseivivax lentus TaxID=633194 RepID=A0A1N7PSF7_9RHOB|nr:tetratricopeptide repeat protein [Roseivivax lentus]SIT13554.1 hypothetical protein SAMN05421759_11947 [Roseivivax lentus]